MFQKVASFLRAITGGSNRSLIAARLKICQSCDHVRLKEDGRMYCDQCKCPQSRMWPISELTRKLKYVRLRCPIGKWGEDGAMTIKQANVELTNQLIASQGGSIEVASPETRPVRHGPPPELKEHLRGEGGCCGDNGEERRKRIAAGMDRWMRHRENLSESPLRGRLEHNDIKKLAAEGEEVSDG